MDPVSWLQTVIQKFLAIFEPPDARVVILVFYGVGFYLFTNYGTLNNETIFLWTGLSYVAYALADPSLGDSAQNPSNGYDSPNTADGEE